MSVSWSATSIEEPDATRDRAVVRSAMWAAAGDVLGWITELSHGERGVERRTGLRRVAEPTDWKRVIGGRGGPIVRLPAGTYSDDTQMRLAVSRAIRGDGTFDVEAFAKIEMTVWPTYALGAGSGSKAAAANLSKRGVNWFSNFYEKGRQKYLNGGGNGAAMRVQPHVWSSAEESDTLIGEVLRNAIVTHGHPHGFCGAVFHALSLEDVFRRRTIVAPNEWTGYLDRCLDLPKLMEEQPQLAAFWRTEWESKAGMGLAESVQEFCQAGLQDIDAVSRINHADPAECYKRALKVLGCLTPQLRGSGWKTALAALALAYYFRDRSIEETLETAANEFDSDTDTIATMTGALRGAVSSGLPNWPIQDRTYIAEEARRLASIARGESQDSFTYPDLGHWDAPTRQYAAIGWADGQLALSGLGELIPQGDQYSSRDMVWQWCKLAFGQTILAKRKMSVNAKVATTQLPGSRRKAQPKTISLAKHKRSGTLDDGEGLFGDQAPRENVSYRLGHKSKIESSHDSQSQSSQERSVGRVQVRTVDELTDEVISEDFSDRIVGRLLNQCIDESQSVESAVAFAAIIAKAKLMRKRRRR